MSFVFVVDQERKPLDPVHPGRARFLLTAGHAAVLRRYPFTIIMKEVQPDADPQPLRVKIDPGSQTTGMAVVNDTTGQVVWAGELVHQGDTVQKHLDQRRHCRRSRRQRHTRYRPPRFDNRTRSEGWLPPSLESRVQNILTWVQRLCRLAPIGAISLELVKFDTQLMQNAEISGVVYQQGELAGYEIREYLLEKCGRRCAYCGKTKVPFEVEHLTPKARGGSDRVSNLTLACHACNQAKGTQTATEFGHSEVQVQAKAPLKDAAAVNTTRWALYRRLQATGLPVETGTGGRTKWNRTRQELPKTHWLDAVCVGASTPELLVVHGIMPLRITATGRQRRQMCLMDPQGFPRTRAKGSRLVQGFQTGDIVRAVVPSGKPQGTHVGKVAVKARGNFTITTARRKVPDVPYRYCRTLQKADGYQYQTGAALPPQA